MKEEIEYDRVHNWFNLTYASYLVLPRSVLQSMPDEWQNKFIDLVEEISQTLEVSDMPSYKIIAVNDNGKFAKDPFRNYERGRRRIEPKQ